MNRILINAYRIIFLFLLLSIGLSTNAGEPDSLLTVLETQTGEDKFNTLIELSNHYYSVSGRESVKYGLLAVEEADKLKESNALAEAFLCVRDGYNILTLHDSSVYYLNKVLEIKNIDKKYKAKAKSSFTESFYHLGKNTEAIKYGEESIKLYRELGDSLSVAKSFSLISNVYTKQGDYTTALKYGLRALDIFEESGDSLKMALTLMRIGTMYMIKRDRPAARPYYFRAFSIAKKYPNSMTYNNLLASMASYYRLTGNSDSALYFYNKSLNADKILGRKQDIAGTYMNMAHLYLRQDNFDTGYYFLNKALNGFKELDSKENMGLVYSSMGMANFFQGNYDSSLVYTNKSLEIGKETNNSRLIFAAKELLPGIYDKKGEYKKSLNHYREFIAYKDSIDGVKVKGKLAELETKYETAKKEQQILELEHQSEIEKSEKQLQRIIFSGIIFVLLLILIGIWQKRVKDKQIHLQKEELAKSELEKSKIKEEELQQSVLYKSKQLSTHALHMMQKNSMLHEMQSDLKILSKKANIDDKQDFKRINMQINQSLRSHKDWDVFKLYFEDVNKNFYQKLTEINPDLTTNDHRLCALIKLNMNSKEMASVLNVAPNSIKSSRYRLKKKLGLNVEADLEEFIRVLV